MFYSKLEEYDSDNEKKLSLYWEKNRKKRLNMIEFP